jgi:hypothetical protein
MARADAVSGTPGELIDRLFELADDPAPQVRAVVLTLLIKALDHPAESDMLRSMVASDAAGAILDPPGAAQAATSLRAALHGALSERAVDLGERHLVTVLRDYLVEQMDRWAERSVDDVDNRRRAAKLLVLAGQPRLLAAAQRRGFLVGMSADDIRELAHDRLEGPVMPETATELWTQLEAWRGRVEDLLGDGVLLAWELAGGGRPPAPLGPTLT